MSRAGTPDDLYTLCAAEKCLRYVRSVRVEERVYDLYNLYVMYAGSGKVTICISLTIRTICTLCTRVGMEVYVLYVMYEVMCKVIECTILTRCT